MENTSAYDCLP